MIMQHPKELISPFFQYSLVVVEYALEDSLAHARPYHEFVVGRPPFLHLLHPFLCAQRRVFFKGPVRVVQRVRLLGVLVGEVRSAPDEAEQ